MIQYETKGKTQAEKSGASASAASKSHEQAGAKPPVQTKNLFSPLAKPNNTGIPLQMKERFESLSGFSFDDVRIHYNSDKPAQLQALAFTQGNQVYMGPGQEKHLGHELGHVVQQKQGRVRPTSKTGNVSINDDLALEREADNFGSVQFKNSYAEAVNNYDVPAQCLMKEYKKEYGREPNMGFSVVLYAELDGVSLGCFYNTSGKHAEDNLLDYLTENYTKKALRGKTLEITLSTSPCSSTFDTSTKDIGCAEELEKFRKTHRMKLDLTAAKHYIPRGIVDSPKAHSIEAAEEFGYAVAETKKEKDAIIQFNK